MGHPRSRIDLEALFTEHAHGLAGAVRGILGPRAEVQEVLQDAFLRAWQALDSGRQPDDPAAWLFVLTLNRARDLRRQRTRRGPELILDEVESMKLAGKEPDPTTALEGREALDRTRAAIFELEEKQKEVFLLRVSGELSFQAIAEALSIPVGTAKTRMRSALRVLRENLDDLNPLAGQAPIPSAELEGEAQ